MHILFVINYTRNVSFHLFILQIMSACVTKHSSGFFSDGSDEQTLSETKVDIV